MCILCTETAPGTSNCSAAKWPRQINLSHVVTLPHCDTPIVNTLSFTLTLLSHYIHSTLFPVCSITNKPIGHVGLFRLYYYFFYYNLYYFISKHFLIMVLPVNDGNISLSCTIYSQLSVQHVL